MGLDERHQSNKTTKSLLAASLLYCTGHQAQAALAAPGCPGQAGSHGLARLALAKVTQVTLKVFHLLTIVIARVRTVSRLRKSKIKRIDNFFVRERR